MIPIADPYRGANSFGDKYVAGKLRMFFRPAGLELGHRSLAVVLGRCTGCEIPDRESGRFSPVLPICLSGRKRRLYSTRPKRSDTAKLFSASRSILLVVENIATSMPKLRVRLRPTPVVGRQASRII